MVVTPSIVKETSLTTVLADEESPPPLALLADEDDEVDDVALVCAVADADDVGWVPAGERSELAELIVMARLVYR